MRRSHVFATLAQPYCFMSPRSASQLSPEVERRRPNLGLCGLVETSRAASWDTKPAFFAGRIRAEFCCSGPRSAKCADFALDRTQRLAQQRSSPTDCRHWLGGLEACLLGRPSLPANFCSVAALRGRTGRDGSERGPQCPKKNVFFRPYRSHNFTGALPRNGPAALGLAANGRPAS